MFQACGYLALVPVLYHGEKHVHRQDGGGSEEVVGGKCSLVLKVVNVEEHVSLAWMSLSTFLRDIVGT